MAGQWPCPNTSLQHEVSLIRKERMRVHRRLHKLMGMKNIFPIIALHGLLCLYPGYLAAWCLQNA